MNLERFEATTQRYPSLRIAVVGDFCLDRYLEIDAARSEVSIETGLTVHNVTRVRAQPGAAGTILNNLAALGVGTIFPVGFAGDDGEGYELCRALTAKPGVRLDHFLRTSDRRTFTYCKPLILEPGKSPRELNRLDSKNWTPTPAAVERQLVQALCELAPNVDAMILLDQVEIPDTGVVTRGLLNQVRELTALQPGLLIGADSRRGLRGFPPVIFKMNATELAALSNIPLGADLEAIQQTARTLARQNGHPVFITLAERGILGASANGQVEHVAALPVRGEIDIVGAGDAVMANLITALAAGATLGETLVLANAAASVVVHQLGTTGTATVGQLRELLLTQTES